MNRKKITDTVRQIIFSRDRYRCQYCGKSAKEFRIELRKSGLYIIPIDQDGNWFEIDHIIPVKINDDNSLNNLVTCCWKCNSVKSSRVYKIPTNFPRIKLYKKNDKNIYKEKLKKIIDILNNEL